MEGLSPHPSQDARVASLFGDLVPDRDCGDCNACCTHLDVSSDAFEKPAGVPCSHLCDAGCGIYQTRFPICQTWHCLWRHIDVLPEEARPDRLGAIVSFLEDTPAKHMFRRSYISVTLFDKARATQDALLDEVLEMFSEGDIPVWVGDEDGLVLSYPHPDVARCAMGQPNADVVVQMEAARWTSGVRSNGDR